MRYPTQLAGVFFSLMSTTLLACERPEKPTIPDPNSAVTPQMIKAKNDVKAYMEDAEIYLACVQSTKKHNEMVEEMHGIADEFNKTVRAYKKRMAG